MNIEHRELDIQAGTLSLPGILALPSPARGIVVFAHGSGSSRFSSRNRFVADILNRAGLATLLFDLLTAEEHEVDQFTREYRFDIPSVLSDKYLAIQSLAKTPRQGAHRSQWQALGKVRNAALAFLRGSLWARLCGRVALLRLLEMGVAIPAHACLATRPRSHAEWQDICQTGH